MKLFIVALLASTSLFSVHVAFAGSVYIDGVKKSSSFSDFELNQNGDLMIKTTSGGGAGGPALEVGKNGSVNRCREEGAEISMKWALKEVRLYGGLISCPLKPNTRYYFNVAYVDPSRCDRANGCNAIMRHAGGWRDSW